MATLLEPPAIVSLGVTVAAAAGAAWYAVRRSGAARGSAVPVQTEDDEEWGVDPPPAPAKRPYIYPADRPEEVLEAEVEPEIAPAISSARAPEPLPAQPPNAGPSDPPVDTPARDKLAHATAAVQNDPVSEAARESNEDEEEELYLADLFARRRQRPGRS